MRSPRMMRPRSGVTKPAMESSVRVLPAPEGPYRTVTPGLASKARSRVKPAESSAAGKRLERVAWSAAVIYAWLPSRALDLYDCAAAMLETVGEEDGGGG